MSYISSAHEMYWDLKENAAEKKRRAKTLRAIYALVDPNGWDGRRLKGRAGELVRSLHAA